MKPCEVTTQSEESSINIVLTEEKNGEFLPAEEKSVEVHLPEEKTIESTEGPLEEVETNEEIKTPNRKKVPTEERKKEPPTDKRKLPSNKQQKTIHLGNTQSRKGGLNVSKPTSPSEKNIETEVDDKAQKEKEFATAVESPYVEINLDNAEVSLILPKQQLKANIGDEIPQQLSYSLEINGKQQEVIVGMTTNRNSLIFVEEKRILLEEPLEKFRVVFPDEIQWREYIYYHYDKGFYVFVAIGNNRGKMCYLYDKDGNINTLPRRNVWLLLNEKFELQTEPDVIEEKWIWENYQPLRIGLNEIDTCIIKNRISGEEKRLSLQPTFRVEGVQLVEDDYKKECPLFTGETLTILAPYENPSGWNVWILNKVAGYKIKENWTGRDPLTLQLPDDLPCEFGEFQVDICQYNTRIPDETLFLRVMPSLVLNYPKDLIIPDPELGHVASTISVKLDSDAEWELKHKESAEIKVILKQRNSYEIELPPERDTFRFSLGQTSKPETVVNSQVTISRLKWKTTKQKVWNSRLQKIEREDLKPGEPFFLQIKLNDFDNKYDLLALLEANGQKLQEGKFIRRDSDYSLELNQFFDTIKDNKDELTIRVEIHNIKQQFVGSVGTLYFEGEPKVSKMIPPQKPREKITSQIEVLVKCQGLSYKLRRGKGFSKSELTRAGIDLKDVRSLSIHYDRRRKSLHLWNIESLKKLKESDKHAT